MTYHAPPFDWRRALLHGMDLAADNFRDYDDNAAWQAMWELLREAAQVSRAYAGPPRSDYPEKAIWPDAPDEITPWRMQMDYLMGLLPELPEDECSPPMPSAAEVTRADAVLDLWHRHSLWRGAYPHPCKRHIYALAEGRSLGAVMRRSGMRRGEVLALRQRAATEMLRGAGVW